MGRSAVSPSANRELTTEQTLWTGRTRSGTAWCVRLGDARSVVRTFPAESFDCVVTSPPYYSQRDYETPDQIGLEPTIDAYVAAISDVMRDVRRTLTKRGVVFLNLGDTYYSAKGQPQGTDKKNWARRFGLRPVDKKGLGVPKKTLIGIPWRVAIAMVDDGWILRSPIVWKRKRPTPEPSAKDRPWRSYEMVFMFAKSLQYHFDRTGLDGDEDVWEIHSQSRSTNNLLSAYFPEQLVQRCLAIGCPPAGSILDPFAGTGTALRVALASGRAATGIDANPQFCAHMVKDLVQL
jgi:DNA modification methylase